MRRFFSLKWRWCDATSFLFSNDDVWVKLGWFLTFVVFLDKNVEVRSCHFVYCQCQSSWNKEHEFGSFNVAPLLKVEFSVLRSVQVTQFYWKWKKNCLGSSCRRAKQQNRPLTFRCAFCTKWHFTRTSFLLVTVYSLLYSHPRNVSKKAGSSLCIIQAPTLQ